MPGRDVGHPRDGPAGVTLKPWAVQDNGLPPHWSPLSGSNLTPNAQNPRFQEPYQRSDTTIQESDVRVPWTNGTGERRSRSTQACRARNRDPETIARSQGAQPLETPAP